MWKAVENVDLGEESELLNSWIFPGFHFVFSVHKKTGWLLSSTHKRLSEIETMHQVETSIGTGKGRQPNSCAQECPRQPHLWGSCGLGQCMTPALLASRVLSRIIH